jgi:hypothetical protein
MQIALVILVVVAFLAWNLNEATRFRKSNDALEEFHALKLWLIEHMDDCTMSDEKWRKFLPMCRLADERLLLLQYTRLPSHETCEEFVLSMIDDREEEEEDASV